MRRIVVGMSGGVDSSMSLLLLKEQGFSPVGVTLQLPVWEGSSCGKAENACCTEDSLKMARQVCDRLGVEHHLVDVREDFEREVIQYFLREHQRCRTPNPCVMCNPRLKFTSLLAFANANDIQLVATGHYANTRRDESSGKMQLLRGSDRSKDQSYGLAYLSQEQLSRIRFPLGEMTKGEVYARAEEEGFPGLAKKKESQDLCFVHKKELQRLLKEEVGINKGKIVNSSGNVIGKHQGLHFYTIGQAKGIGLEKRYRVKGFDIENNRLIVTGDDKQLQETEAQLDSVHFISGDIPEGSLEVEAKVRYAQEARAATLFPEKDGTARIVFEKPQTAVAPGQFCVFYSSEVCLGAGRIIRPESNQSSRS